MSVTDPARMVPRDRDVDRIAAEHEQQLRALAAALAGRPGQGMLLTRSYRLTGMRGVGFSPAVRAVPELLVWRGDSQRVTVTVRTRGPVRCFMISVHDQRADTCRIVPTDETERAAQEVLELK